LNIACASSREYLYPAKVMLYSLLINNDCEINVYLLTSELQDEAINELGSYLKKISPKCFLYPIRVDKNVFANMPIIGHFSVETYYRIQVLKVLPESVDRVLFFDADLLITDNIEDFYNQDFNDNLVIACKDYTISGQDLELYKKLNLPDYYMYINAGMLFYNIKEIRKRYQWNTIIKFIAEKKDIITWLDQDIVNMLFCENVKVCEHFYNEQVPNILSRAEELFVRKTAKIIHYCSYRKPWDSSYAGIMSDIWWSYAVKAGYKLDYEKFKKKSRGTRAKRCICGAVEYICNCMRRTARKVLKVD
jgi:lipopolysaccharide biosynthesis glycosyltransferase